ncbi:PEGA domain-containing protein [Candidatus Saccharibacteria bacterium]|nr:PEGA domain-containing protein [Candidatus Saccharibacteria bacterium]
MDFLDPRKRRQHDLKLMIGYGLMTIAIGLTSVILIYGAYGYGINTKTGAIIQNGLLFVDSQPSGASIFLNNKRQSSTTAARLVLPAGNYNLTISKEGYRDWSRKFTLTEHSIERFTYPFLFPAMLTSQNIKLYPSEPQIITQSPDMHWLLVQSPSADPANFVFDMYNTGKIDQPPTQLTLPTSVLTVAGAKHSLSVVEWASDNNHLLLKHSYLGGDEFIIFDRLNPASSLNVSRAFGAAASKMNLRNSKIDQLYIYNQADGSLSLGDIAKTSVQPLLSQVLAYKAYGSDLISYVTSQNADAGQVMARIWENGKTYPLFTFPAGAKYFVDAAQYSGHWYYAAGSDTANRVNIYKDPLSGIKDPLIAKAIPMIALSDSGITTLSFSDESRFVGVEAGQKFGIYDIETQSRYQYTLAAPLAGEMHWMDGSRLIGLSGGSLLVMDYDAINQQVLIPTINSDKVYFDKSFTQIFSLAATDGGITFQHTDLRAGVDLPKQ